MIATLKALIARHWPVMRLRTMLFGTLLFVAALPGFGAIFLRVYENALVRRTEAELIAQGSALAAIAAILWHGQPAPAAPPDVAAIRYHDQLTEVDLRSSPILATRPPAAATHEAPDIAAVAVARRIVPAFQETKVTTLSSILMLDRRGIILNGEEAGCSLAALPEIRTALGGQATTVLRLNEHYVAHYPLEWLSRAANIRLHYARPIRVGGEVVGAILVSRSPRALFRGIYEDRGKIALGIALIFLLLIFLSALLSRAIVRPIEGLSRATRDLASGRAITAARPSLQVVEIRTLFDDFERMAGSIDKRSRYLRDFASSLSHEFKTPLAGISGAIELLQDHGSDMAPEDRTRFLANMASDAERLSRLVRRLMELARADVLVGGQDARADAAFVIATVADAMSNDGFAVRIDVPEAVPPLAIDPDVLEAVLTTLVENARQAGASSLSFTLLRSEGQIWIDVSDNGPGIPAGDRNRIFDPFFTSKRDRGGTGLGLVIARSLLTAYNGHLQLLSAGCGTVFRISCPVW